MVTNPEILKEQYQLRFSKLEAYRNNIWKILCCKYFSQYILSNARVLDLGSGWGEFINNIDCAEKFAMDLNPSAKEHLPDTTHFLNQDCSQSWQIPSETLDVVFTSNFLEHLPNKDLAENTISEAFRCLKDGGLILCMGPNIKYLPGQYWDFWDHYTPITDLSLSELLKLKGFGIQSCLPRFLPYSMSTGRTPPLFLVKLYLKLPILWPFLGKQFFVVGKKVKKVEL